jgi:hypothetical protein
VDSEIMTKRWKTGSGGDIVRESEVDAHGIAFFSILTAT